MAGFMRGIFCFSINWNGVLDPSIVGIVTTAAADTAAVELFTWLRRDFDECGFMWLSMCFFTSGSEAKRLRQFGIGQQNGRSP